MTENVEIKFLVDDRQINNTKAKIDSLKKDNKISLNIESNQTVKLNLDDKKARNVFDILRRDIDKERTLKLNLDTSKVNYELSNIERRINALSSNSININVNTNNISNNITKQLTSGLNSTFSGAFFGTMLGSNMTKGITNSINNVTPKIASKTPSDIKPESNITIPKLDSINQLTSVNTVLDSLFKETNTSLNNLKSGKFTLPGQLSDAFKTPHGSTNIFNRMFGSIGNGFNSFQDRIYNSSQLQGGGLRGLYFAGMGATRNTLGNANQDWNNFFGRISNGFRNNPLTRHFESTGLNQSLRNFRDGLASTGQSILKWGVVGAGLFTLHGVINTVTSVFGTLVNVTKQMITTGMAFNAQKEMQTATYKALATYETGGNKAKAGQISKELYKNIETFAKDTIMDTQGVAESVRQAMGYGINAEGAFSIVKKMSEFTGGNSDKLYRGTRGMVQAYSYGKLRAQEKNQLIEADVPIVQILDDYGKSIGKENFSKRETIAWEDLAAAIDLATNKGGQYYGVIDSLSNTMTGKIAKLKDTVLITLGNAFEKVFNNIKTNYMDNLIKKVEELGKTLEKVDFNAVFDEMAKGGNTVLKKLVAISGLEWSKNPEENAKNITKSLKDITKALTDVTGGILDVTKNFKDFWDKMQKWGDDWDNTWLGKLQDPKWVDNIREFTTSLFPWNDNYGNPNYSGSKSSSSYTKATIQPTIGVITSKFGDARDGGTRKHAGQDYGAPMGSNVSSVYGGSVYATGWMSGYGNYVDIKNSSTGLIERFAHLSNILVNYGETVKKGQVIAKSGNSGGDYAPHLHYEIIDNGVSVDPAKVLSGKYKTKTTKKTTSSDKGSKYDKYFEKYGEKYGVDSELLKGMANVETGGSFDPNAKSPVGAMGLMQFMPGTWAAYGSGSAYNAENSINAAGKYMSNLLNKFGGDTEKALAAYNAGPGAVEKAINKDSVNWLSLLPKETRDYVPKVMSKFENYGGNILDTVTGASTFEIDKENEAKQVEIFKSQWEQAQRIYENDKTQTNFDAIQTAYNTYKNARDAYNNSYLEDLDKEKALILSQTEDTNQQAEIMKAWQNNHSLFVSIQKQKYDLANAKWEGNKKDKTLKAMADEAYANYQSSRDSYNNTWFSGNERIKAQLEAQIEDQQRLNSLLSDQKSLVDSVTNSYGQLYKFSGAFDKLKIERFSPGKLERRTNKNFAKWQKWTDNLAQLQSMGVGAETIYELRNMGVDSLGIAEGLIKATSEQRNKIIGNINNMSNIALSNAAMIVKHEIDGTILIKSDMGNFNLSKDQVEKIVADALSSGSNRFLP